MAAPRKKTPQTEIHRPWVWEHRVGLTPFIISVLLLFYTVGFPGAALTSWQFVPLTLVIALAFDLIARRKWGGRNAKVAETQMLYFTETLIVTCTAAAIVTKIWGQLTLDWVMWEFVVWTILTLVFGAFWWNDHANLIRIQREREIVHWPMLAERIRLPHVNRSAIQKTKTGRKCRLWWTGGQHTKSEVKAALERIESVMEIPQGLAKFEDVTRPDGEIDPNQIELVWNDQAPGRKEAIDFDGQPTAKSGCDLLTIAYREDGEPVQLSLYDKEYGGQHMLAGGTTGSGKSGFYHLLMAELADARDVVRWGMDLKGGMAFRPWAPLFDWFIDDEKQVLPMFTAIRAIIDARAKYAARRGWDPWQPDEDHPTIVLCIDECAVPFGQGNWQTVELAKIIAQQGRAVGVILCVATQHATNEAVGSQQIMKNITRRFAFRCSDMTQQGVLLPTIYDAQVNCTAIPTGKKHAGKFFWSDGGEVDKLLARVRFVTKAMIKEIVAQYWEYRCDLDKGSARAARLATQEKDGTNAYDSRHVWTLEDVQGATDKLLPDEVLDDAAIWDEIFGTSAEVTEPSHNQRDAGSRVSEVPNGTTTGDGTSGPSGPVTYSEEEFNVPYDETKDDVTIAQIVTPTNQEDADDLTAAIEAWNAERSNRVSKEEAHERLDRALLAAGREGAQFKDLMEICGRQKSWVHEELIVLMRDSKTVHQPKRGWWAYTDIELSRRAVAAPSGN